MTTKDAASVRVKGIPAFIGTDSRSNRWHIHNGEWDEDARFLHPEGVGRAVWKTSCCRFDTSEAAEAFLLSHADAAPAPAPASEPAGELPTCDGVWCQSGDLFMVKGANARRLFMNHTLDVGYLVPADHLVRGGWTHLLPANAELSRLRADLASVTAERDGLKILNRTYGHNVSELAKNCDDLEARAGMAESQLTALRQRLERAEGALREALSAIDEAYEATGYFKVAKDSVQRQKIVAALADKGATDAE
jgi:hypothetical protein